MKNHLKNTLLAALLVALIAGCAETPDVYTHRDPMTNQETDLISENELPSSGGVVREVIWLNASRLPINGQYKIFLEVMHAANKEAGHLEIYPGRTLTILADGQELRFGGLGGLDKFEKGNVAYEVARYEAKQSDIETIANASKVTVLVQGKDALIERNFAPENSARFKQFAEKISFVGQPIRPRQFKTPVISQPQFR